MYVYVDETGNTGRNMFDENQPFFASLAIMHRENFDNIFSTKFAQLALRHSLSDLHARKMSPLDYDMICGGIFDIIHSHEIKFSYIYVDKKTHAAIKLFDTIFDEGENYAVPWHVYWLKEMRYILLAKFVHIIDIDTLKEFWTHCLTQTDKSKAMYHFINVVKRLKENIPEDCDERSREIFIDAFGWAMENHENITYYTYDDQTRLTHMPNVAFFGNLMRNIEEQYEEWGSKECIICHDRQSEFEIALAEMHRMLSSSAMPEFLKLASVFNKKTKLRALEKSVCTFRSSSDSCGIQLCDICLSVMSKILKNKSLSNNQEKLYKYIVQNTSSHYTLDYDSLISEASMIYDFFMNVDISNKKMKEGKKLLKKIEKRRREKMQKKFPFSV